MSEMIWKSVAGFEGIYEVSSTGLVRSLDRVVKNGLTTTKIAKGKILRAGRKENGYLQVCLGRRNNRYVHRLVGEAFVPNPNNRPEIDHIDGNRQNNSCDNLRWVNRSENNFNPVRVKKVKVKVLQLDPATGEVVAEHGSMIEAAEAVKGSACKISRAAKTGICHRGYKWTKK